jgi:cell fate regulator YaaT (PSP1 superfamily)
LKTFLILYGKPRYLGFLKAEEDLVLRKGDSIVIESQRGREIGIVAGPISPAQEERYRKEPSAETADASPKTGNLTDEVKFIGFPLPDEAGFRKQCAEEETQVLYRAREILKSHNLVMKLVDVEYLLDRSKLFFYFTAEQRIDFRGFVRDLAREFKTRIELRQIGGRDEAKVAAGIAQCGMPCCCSTWLNQFEPICIKMVKQQNLALNPTKISGICGRLMCCMGYEHQTYQELWKGLPNPGTKLKSLSGETYLITGVDLMGKSLRIFCPDRTELLVPVSEFAKFKEAIQKGEVWEPQREEVVALPFDSLLQEAVTDSERILEDGVCPAERTSRTRPGKFLSRERGLRRIGERETRERELPAKPGAPVGPSTRAESPAQEETRTKRRRPRRKKRKPATPAPETAAAPSKPAPENRIQALPPSAEAQERPHRKRNSRRRKSRKPQAEE